MMRNGRLLAVFLLLALWALPVKAKIRPETLNRTTQMTAGQLFLNQVDTVALYLSTGNIIYVPRLKENTLQVQLVFLGSLLAQDMGSLKNLALRHIETFVNTLEDRVQFYTPQIAKEFDTRHDVVFSILRGSAKETVARWQAGRWEWVRSFSSEENRGKTVSRPVAGSGAKMPIVDLKEGEVRELEQKRCPALIGGKKEPKVARGEVSQDRPEVEEEPIEKPVSPKRTKAEPSGLGPHPKTQLDKL